MRLGHESSLEKASVSEVEERKKVGKKDVH